MHWYYAFVTVCSGFHFINGILSLWKVHTRSVFSVVYSGVDWLSPHAQLLPGCVNVQQEVMSLLSFSRLGYLSKDRCIELPHCPQHWGTQPHLSRHKLNKVFTNSKYQILHDWSLVSQSVCSEALQDMQEFFLIRTSSLFKMFGGIKTVKRSLICSLAFAW